MQKLHNIEQEIRDTAGQRPISVKAIVLTEECNILLLRRPNNDKWDLPGGGVDAGESLVDAIIREVHEETGLTVNNARPIYTFIRHAKNKPEKLIQFVICRLDKETEQTPINLSHEHSSFSYVEFSQIMTLSLMPSYREALLRAREVAQKEFKCY